MKKAVILFMCALMCCYFCSCEDDDRTRSSTQIMMSTVITVTIHDGSKETLDGAISLCRRYEQLLSRTVDSSDIGRINASGGEPCEVSGETAELLRTALEICEKSGGKFDITVSPLTDLWDVSNTDSVPSDKNIAEMLQLVDYRKLKIDGNTVTLPDGMAIDLGGIAKGYIADKTAEYLTENGVTRAVINLGGNVSVIGDNNGNPYSVGIQKPFSKQGEIAASVLISDKTAVTSGVYERYFESNGKIYHHITDTSTGYPVDNGLYSVTIIADSSSIADGLSTSCLALGLKDGMALAESYGAEAIFIDSSGNISLSKGLVADYSGDFPIITLIG